MKESLGSRMFSIVNAAFLLAVSLVMLFPIYFVFVVSFTDPTEYLLKGGIILFPREWSLTSYRFLMSNNAFIHATGISAFLATVGTSLSLIVTSSLAYAVSRKRMKGRKMILILVLITTLFNPGMIPPYLLVRSLGLINSIWALIIPVLTSGWYILLMKGFFDSIPDSLEEAASIDGYNDLQIWFRIILPLSLPSLAAFGLFFAVDYWNTFFSAILYMTDFKKWPLQVLLQNMLIDSSSSSVSGPIAQELAADMQIPPETLKMAAIVIAVVPILLVYPFLQKHFAKGAMIGSVKE